MKIVYCLPCTCNPGGIEKIVVQKANWFAEKGHDVTIITTEQHSRSPYFPLNPSIRCVDLAVNYSDNKDAGVFKRFFSRNKKIKKHRKLLSGVLDNIKPDVTISTFGNEVGFLNALQNTGKTILEIHFSRWFRIQTKVSFLHHLANMYLTKADFRLVKKYDAFVCLTDEDRLNWGDMENIHVIPNFTDIEPCQHKQSGKRAIAVGRISYQKGYDRLIAAWKIVNKSHPDWTLSIYGDGDLELSLREQIQRSGLHDVVQINKSTKNIAEEYAQSDFLVMTSNYEGLPMVLIEAMTCGLPLISFACQCGPKDVIDSTNGILVENGNIEEFARAINKVIESEEYRRRLSEGAISSAKKYTSDSIMPLWENLINNLMNNENEEFSN